MSGRRHRWMAFLPFELTPEDARRMSGGDFAGADLPPSQLAAGEVPAPDDVRPFFGLHNLVRELATVGCFECEQPYSDDVAAQACPGEPPGKLAWVGSDGQDLQPGELPAARQHQGQAFDFRGVGRNERCPCGSGLKFKQCHGR